MKISYDVLRTMLVPGTAIVRREFRCRCRDWFTVTAPGLRCVRAATEEDGLCDGCRQVPRVHDVLWVSDVEARSLAVPADLLWPPRHTCILVT